MISAMSTALSVYAAYRLYFYDMCWEYRSHRLDGKLRPKVICALRVAISSTTLQTRIRCTGILYIPTAGVYPRRILWPTYRICKILEVRTIRVVVDGPFALRQKLF